MPNRRWRLGSVIFVGLIGCGTGAGRVPASAAPVPCVAVSSISAQVSAKRDDRSNAGFERTQGIARRIRIEDFDGLTGASSSAITRAALGRRKRAALADLPGSVQIQTRCGENYCVDGLSVQGREFIAPVLSSDEQRVYGDNLAYWLERVIVVAWQDEAVISVYIAESEFSGGASANNQFVCRSYDKRKGAAFRLQDVLPPNSTNLLLAKVRGLLDPNVAIDELGEELGAAGFAFHQEGFRFARTAAYRGNQPELVLCGEGPYPSESASILELRVEAIPVGYLLR